MQWSYGAVIRRALATGAIVGVLLAGYTYVVVEPSIDAAIRLEEAGAHAHDHDEPLFTRSQQKGGGTVAALVYAVVVAGIFGTVYAALRHRIPAASELTRAFWLASAGFVSLALVPALKYPAMPPGAASADDASQRTVQYVICLVAAVLVAVLLTRLSGALRSRLRDHARLVLVVVSGVAAYALLLVLLPPAADAADRLPAGLVWDFRIRSLGGLALLWGGLGLGLGWLLDHAATGAQRHRVAVDR
jgi:predicted cobalt transporter CbtA